MRPGWLSFRDPGSSGARARERGPTLVDLERDRTSQTASTATWRRRKVGILRQVVVADTDAEALAATRTANTHWFRSITKLWHDDDDHFPDSLCSWASRPNRRPSSSARQARARADRESLEVSGCNHANRASAWGTLPTSKRWTRRAYLRRR